jgi:2-keto-4-pentenoate hydratase/2-oxohepta-3-ene-1,7-dioic acid hydratase in catechol pathway
MSTTRYVRIHDDPPRWARLDGDDAELLDTAPWVGVVPTGERRPRAGLRFAVPATPTKIVCVGRNYLAHAKELGNTVPTEPLLFFKPPSSLLGPGGTVVLPPESERVEHEGELAVVIGKRGRRIPKSAALEHVFGYAVACDVTARDLQKKDGQWTRAKGFDTFCPLGAELVTGVDPGALSVRVHVGDELRQDGNTKDMAFDVPTLVAYISNVMTLEPGDLILTGTPEGVGPIRAGDIVRVDIEGVGALSFGVS